MNGVREACPYLIWTNDLAGTDAACADMVRSSDDAYLSWSEDEVRERSHEESREELEVQLQELERLVTRPVLIYGVVGTWRGPRCAHAIKFNLHDVVSTFTGDVKWLFVEDGDLYVKNVHHDGTDRFVIRMFKEDEHLDELDISTWDDVLEHTESLAPAITAHYGWKVEDVNGKCANGTGKGGENAAS